MTCRGYPQFSRGAFCPTETARFRLARMARAFLFAIIRVPNNKLVFTISTYMKVPATRRAVSICLFGLAALASSAEAQATRRSDTGISISGVWLQANALPLDRDAMQSGSAAIGIRRSGWAAEVGWLRVARTLSTVQGGSLSIQRPMHWRSLVVLPAVNFLGGRAYASVDTTGYDWTAGGTTGHTPRYTYSEGGSFGGGAGVTVEIPIYRGLALRGVASQWVFSGASLEGDRARTLLGVGLSALVGR